MYTVATNLFTVPSNWCLQKSFGCAYCDMAINHSILNIRFIKLLWNFVISNIKSFCFPQIHWDIVTFRIDFCTSFYRFFSEAGKIILSTISTWYVCCEVFRGHFFGTTPCWADALLVRHPVSPTLC